ncbi:MAG TPA: hypothetical protein IGS52_21635 [Oscillatoriaceae cyanobacterium M33_DOE_052]|uniref:CHAT domain-containing protein n=1 Tax=Planktothricoides sp. SpSt-374 TaxID=2282167 RepID=A0A7C3VNB1_9CYAN|nr:hypothetical protein [Oscillatoriaceae cyanobacterium M33_DOE_052]
MAALNRSTRRRLQKLPQIPSVWEGDRRPLAKPLPGELPVGGENRGLLLGGSSSSEPPTDCILWVDGSQGFVRAIDTIDASTGPNAVVRTLLRAMEVPHNPAKPGRPQKIVVKDREMQFFLRGALQELDIAIEYVPHLPLIDEIFRELQQAADNNPPHVPPLYAEGLNTIAHRIWEDAPWEILEDHHVIAIHMTTETGAPEPSSLYAIVMGKLGLDYGILLYRSLESLKQFRASVLESVSPVQMQEAFLSQDCLFLTFEAEDDEEVMGWSHLAPENIEPTFGNLHPLEGLRSYLYEDEAISTLVALEAIHSFFKAHRRRLKQWVKMSEKQRGTQPGKSSPHTEPNRQVSTAIAAIYTLEIPQKSTEPKKFTVEVSTLPDITMELEDMEVELESVEDDLPELPLLRDDLVPANSFLSLGAIPWKSVEILRLSVPSHQSAAVTTAGDGLPIIIIQTTRPKAKAMIEQLQQAGGVKGICFNPGEDPIEGNSYDLGIVQTEDGELHLFGEFFNDDPIHLSARKKWDDRCRRTKGYCGLIIAMGLTGNSRGNPQIKDMLALFEARSLSSKDLDLGILQRIPMPF